DTTLSLRDVVPGDRRLVTESGIHTRADVERMRAAGVDAFLVGEAFMREPDPGEALRQLFFPPPPAGAPLKREAAGNSTLGQPSATTLAADPAEPPTMAGLLREPPQQPAPDGPDPKVVVFDFDHTLYD